MTNLLYLSQMRLPTEKAHGLQMMDIAAARRDGRPEQDAHDHARAHYGLPEGVAKVSPSSSATRRTICAAVFAPAERQPNAIVVMLAPLLRERGCLDSSAWTPPPHRPLPS